MNDVPEYPPAAPPAAPPVDPAEPAAITQVPPELAGYPVQLNIDHQAEYSRFMPLIKWLLAIPHFIVLMFLGIAAYVVVVISFFAVLITGKYPKGMFDFVVGVTRWGFRVNSYILLMRDGYPPFSLQPDPDFGVDFDIAYPADGVNRWRPLVHWLLIIPFAIIASIIFYIAYVAVFFAFFTILFTKKFPKGLFDFVHVALNWNARSTAYSIWMTTKYPPFTWG